VVLLDALAADGEVLALAEAVQADPALAGLPVVLLASMGLDAQGAALRRRGVAAWSSKPVAAAQLHECLRRLLANAPAPVAPPPAPEVPAPAAPAGKLLIVEDNAVNQKVALGIVKQLGFEADLAVHGLNALEALGHDRYDAVLMDCQMPVMDGYQATREIRLREGGRRRLPIIAFTANADQGDRERCLEAGMDDYITKPVRPDELRTTIERWVRPPEPCVDPEVIESLRALQGPGEPDLVAELVALFEQDGPAALAQLRAAVAARDVALAKQTAHTLKGCAANIGAKGLAERCALLEREAEGPDPGLVAGIATELDHVLVALRRLAAPAHA
jgi:CheY-like chemotaxis protein/HPt (histidine-containing phosphotransfer) domain-containing protein